MAIQDILREAAKWRSLVWNILDPSAAASGDVLTADGAGSASYQSAGGGGGGGVPAGSMMFWTTPTPPSGWLFTEGQFLETAVYTELFAEIGYSFGGSGDFFRLPDLRGEAIRVFNNGGGVDPDVASRTDRGDGTAGDAVGTKQSGAVENITGAVNGTTRGQYASASGAFVETGSQNVSDFSTGTLLGNNFDIDASRVVNTSDFETRMTNVQFPMIIRVGTTTAPTPTGADMWDLITTEVISGSPALVDLTWNEGTYNEIRAVLDGIQPAIDGVNLRARLGHSDGATIFDQANDYDGVQLVWEGTPAFSALAGTDRIDLLTSTSNAANETISGSILVLGGRSADLGAMLKADLTYINNTSNMRAFETKAFLDDGNIAAIDTLRLFFASGNFANVGSIKLYGLRQTA